MRGNASAGSAEGSARGVSTPEESVATSARATGGHVVVVCGLPGAGKTTVAERITDRLDATRLRTDVIRKELFPDPDYTDAESEAVYDELFARCRSLVADDDPAVLDATFREAAKRSRARGVSEAVDVPFSLVEVTCEDPVVRERIRARTDDASDADVEVYDMYRDLFEPIETDHLVVDNSGSLAETRRQVDRLFAER
ncbi:AAA family ATPase [Halomarina rubra]|uniref:AAA family ATPase n=1 Tax=Halomarina rubra TaxID=2071873 RepID=A0ABD6AYB9_9EURY|nr:AAA family ATPase [Halomarina rubra]